MTLRERLLPSRVEMSRLPVALDGGFNFVTYGFRYES